MDGYYDNVDELISHRENNKINIKVYITSTPHSVDPQIAQTYMTHFSSDFNIVHVLVSVLYLHLRHDRKLAASLLLKSNTKH